MQIPKLDFKFSGTMALSLRRSSPCFLVAPLNTSLFACSFTNNKTQVCFVHFRKTQPPPKKKNKKTAGLKCYLQIGRLPAVCSSIMSVNGTPWSSLCTAVSWASRCQGFYQSNVSARLSDSDFRKTGKAPFFGAF